jgi:membrane fusion protein, multidrug efflux system
VNPVRFVRILILIVVVIAVAGGAAWYLMRPTPVETVTPRRGEAAEIVYASGVVEPRRWAKITPILRERIVETCECEGEHVEQGAVLARLDDTEAQAQLAELQVRHKLAEEEYQRVAILVERRTMSQQSLDRARSEVAQLEASLAGQRARLDNYVIRSPVGGQVLRQDAEVGEIAELGTALFWVGEPKPLVVIADVNEEDIPQVEAGQRALLRSDAFPARPLEATVDSITPKGDPVTKTYRVRFRLPDNTPLRIGMSVDVNVVISTVEDALLLPSIAISGDRVFTVEGDRVRLRQVETGIRGSDGTQIVSGLEGGERVVSPYPEDLADGARVEIAGG